MANSKFRISKTVIVLALLAGLSILCTYQFLQLREKNAIIADIDEAVNPAPADTGKRWYDAYENEHVKVKALEQSQAAFNILYKKEKAESAKLLGIKEKQIEGLQMMVATLQGSLNAPVDNTVRGDTTSSAVFVDPWSIFKTFTVGDKQTLNYNIRVPIKFIPYWERKYKFLGVPFGKVEHFIDASTTNKNVRLDSVKAVSVFAKEPQRRWGGGLAGGYGYGINTRQFDWWFGVTINYDFIRW